ncbi:MAG: thioredoxin [Azospira oryzae]|nr:MAG: thioredoxin [Azospira oryzae]PZP82210.1 MAG: thioredoxin [Azospira oryzae]
MLQRLRFCAAALLAVAGSVLAVEKPAASNASAYAFDDHPAWFKESFLDFREDIQEAAAAGKRLMIYFGQDGCPYCKALMEANFTQKDIVEVTRKHFDVIAINIWGDRPVTWIDGKQRSEKAFAAHLKVQFTPTLLFLDEKGNVVLRTNGYYPPPKFRAALDYVSQRLEARMTFPEYLAKATNAPSGKLHDQPFFMKPPLVLQRDKVPANRPLAVLFEQPACAPCDELHAVTLKAPQTLTLIRRFDVAQVDILGKRPVVTPTGERLTEAQWANKLKIGFAPSVVFFDERGREVFRIEAYLKPFHFQSALDYVASKGYREQPSFQRFLQARADRLRAEGKAVEIW